MTGFMKPVGVYYSGCNTYSNSCTNPDEPKSTVTAIHICDECRRLSFCEFKQMEEVFNSTEQLENKRKCYFEMCKEMGI